MKFFNHPEGYVEPHPTLLGTWNYVYQCKDHLGNVRLSYADENGNGSVNSSEIREENNYYPFGLKHKGYNDNVSAFNNGVASRWKFGGKEYNQELGLDWYDVSARNYDPALGRWFNIDPLANEFYSYSPYNYAMNDPIRFIDPDGRAAFDWRNNGDGTWTAEEGDSAGTLARDAGISYERANELVQAQHGSNRVDSSGNEFSNIDPEAVVAIPEQQTAIALVELDNELNAIVEQNTADALSQISEKEIVDLGFWGDFTGAHAQIDALEIYENEGLMPYLYEQIRINHSEIMQEGVGGGRGRGRARGRNRSTIRKSRGRGSSKTTISGSGGSSKKTSAAKRARSSWDEFRSQNKGKYKGKDWIQRMSADYQKWKKSQ